MRRRQGAKMLRCLTANLEDFQIDRFAGYPNVWKSERQKFNFFSYICTITAEEKAFAVSY